MNNGKLISFEGIEGVGKSTTINYIKKFLEKNNLDVYCTREPGGTKFGESIRDILLSNKSVISPEAELLLIFAIRNQHIMDVIIPKLKNGTWVLCDRFIDASFAYQGYGKKVNLKKIESLVDNFTKKVLPDLTIFFNLPHNLAKNRFPRNKHKDRFENLNDVFFNDVYNGYMKLVSENKKRIKSIDANQNKDSVQKQIIRELAAAFEEIEKLVV